ncbi:riboflavin biosynthesis protein [Desulfosarcina ovata subsp. sediminis]|uniref:Riboflavin biosynthesis protein n=1 Tax=Desulfosarcina ovata subsp. sediminis TaxID=885957 RepID=A0A5K7ZJR8_9BACT|nr:bifunctional riboflavin kinase/FAD synthetase [Desulfosarcina ovata]BBO80217.1 riboflavin biosynthesis protein [Desulfosarcina ovata subsp. sediminis]
MKIIQDINSITEPFKSAVITIGNFDGVHIGHQALFHEVIERADAMDGTAVAITFDPHPIRVITNNGHPPLITLNEQKTELIEKAGIDVLICIPFTMEFAALSARTFVEEVLIRRIGMKAIVVGEDYTFGNNREGNVELLKRFGEEMGFSVVVADWIQSVREKNARISSTSIRQLVMEGDVISASRMLGRNYQIRGTVAHGRDRGGRLLGIPTANIILQDELCPKLGVYAVIVECDGKRYQGVANIGFSPTFGDHIFTVEVHILDFNQNIYDQRIMVDFVQRLRNEKKFSGIDELIEQIRQDIIDARKILAPHFE